MPFLGGEQASAARNAVVASALTWMTSWDAEGDAGAAGRASPASTVPAGDEHTGAGTGVPGEEERGLRCTMATVAGASGMAIMMLCPQGDTTVRYSLAGACACCGL
jgi:hypothetical protein